MILFETTVINIGNDVEEFIQENMLVLFGEGAPPELIDFCHIIKKHPLVHSIRKGMTININHASFVITAVGNVVEENLQNLGHITINFNGLNVPELPGTIYVEKKPIPKITIGDTISISN